LLRLTRLVSLLATAWALAALAAAPAVAADPAFTSPLLPASAAAPTFTEILATRDTLAALRTGGFTLYLRHAPTDTSRGDRYPSVDLKDCSTQRQLSEEGKRVAEKVGLALWAARIPLADVFVSPMCRAKDTATAVLPRMAVHEDPLLMYTANMMPSQKTPILRRTRELLSRPVPPGSNRLLIAHGPNLMDVMGYFPKEATLVIFQPEGNGQFTYVASIPAGHWSVLLPPGAFR